MSNLVNKLAQIRRDLRNIEKKGRNENRNYDFMRAEDVAGDIGDRLADAGIVVVREDWTESTKAATVDGRNGPRKVFLSTVAGYYVFVDGDTGERLRTWSAGSGMDDQDKACFKAQTGALKYALTQALCMRVGHMDPEDDSDERKQGTPAGNGKDDTGRREPAAGSGKGAPPEDDSIGF